MPGPQPLLHDLAITLRAPTVVLAAPDGQVRGVGTQGVLSGDVRVLRSAVVTVDGREPEPVGHSLVGSSEEHFLGLLRRLVRSGPDPSVWLRRERSVRADGLVEQLLLVNRSESDVSVELAVRLTADLAGIDLIKSGDDADLVAPTADGDAAVWRTGNVTSVVTGTAATLVVDGPAVVLRWQLDLPARSTQARQWSLRVQDRAPVVASTVAGGRPLRVRADDARLARFLERSLDDLDALRVTAPGSADAFAAAGAPWYLTLFGRDSIWTASMLLPVDVTLAAGTLHTLARLQGRTTDVATGEQPGKILHEVRRGDGHHGGTFLPPRYYGTIDATPLWIVLLRDAWRWGAGDEVVRVLLPNLRAALDWLAEHADRDGDGFAEYFDDSGRGLANQGWKDSDDAIRYADGSVADAPVALVEVQGYVYEALLAGAELLEAFDAGDPVPWRARAAELRDRFRVRFWIADGHGRYPALALDGGKRPVDALSSNIGHLLGTGLLDAQEADDVGRRLLAADMLSGFGLRTMSRDTGGYSPLSYHCGSVWPHDTAIVARELARAGQAGRAAALAVQLLDAAETVGWRLPELYGGFGVDESAQVIAYPAACRPQAWSAASAVAVMQVLLGLTVDVPRRMIRLCPPRPSPVGALEVAGLPIGAEALDVRIDRSGHVVGVEAPAGYTIDTQ